MIIVFPTLASEETFYSGCAKASVICRFASRQAFVEDIFGRSRVTAVVDLPAHLDAFVSRLAPGSRIIADDIINNHSLFPLYSVFLPPSRAAKLKLLMHGTDGSSIHCGAGIMAGNAPILDCMRLCPGCVDVDRQKYGEAYWHRVHQYPGVFVCPNHGVPLVETTVSLSRRSLRYEFVTAENALSKGVRSMSSLVEKYQDQLFAIARDCQWILQHYNECISLNCLLENYRTALIERGLALYSGKLNVEKILDSFLMHYSSEFLTLVLGDFHTGNNWPLRLFRKPRNAYSPIQHLLVMHWLDGQVDQFMLERKVRAPFGVGPFPCLNRASDHYCELRITDYQLLYTPHTKGKPQGVFRCSCGFTYSRTGPDQSPSDRYCIGKIRAFGPVWDMTLRELWNTPELSLRGIARSLGVDPNTAKHQAERLGLLFPRHGKRPTGRLKRRKQEQKTPNKSHIDYRGEWLSARQRNPIATITQLRQSHPRIYSWLYRNDPEWLKLNLPKSSKRIVPKLRADWDKRDGDIVLLVKDAAESIKKSTGPSRRITKTAIARYIGQSALFQRHSEKLPLTMSVLAGFIETRIEFAIRRIWQVLDDCRNKHLTISKWQLIKRTGVERLLDNPMVATALSEACSQLSED